jgi:hypothetical protein
MEGSKRTTFPFLLSEFANFSQIKEQTRERESTFYAKVENRVLNLEALF